MGLPRERRPAMAGKKKGKKAKGASAEGAQKEKEPKRSKAAKEKEAKVSSEELKALRAPVEEAKAKLDGVREEAKVLTGKAHAMVAEAKGAYMEALAPYREACRKADHPCEFEGGRSTNVSEKVTFLVEKLEKGIRVTVKGKPDTEELIPMAALKESIGKAAYAFTEKHLGPREEIGNKGGSLSNRLRAALQS